MMSSAHLYFAIFEMILCLSEAKESKWSGTRHLLI
jgi:hypothetical protein